jgi:putative transposase
MPWRECNVMDERVKFVARLLEGEKMAALCREFDISRKTGYKILERYEDTGLEGLTDRSRRPYRHANQLPFQIEALIVRLKHEKPTWGAPKIMELLARRYPDVQVHSWDIGYTSYRRHRLHFWPFARRARCLGGSVT